MLKLKVRPMQKNVNMKFKIIFFLIILFINVSAQKKFFSVSGYIKDKESGESLVGANVFIEKLSLGAATNSTGYFVIPSVPEGKYKLTVSYIGYETKVIDVNIGKESSKILEIYLEPAGIVTEEVVVSDKSANLSKRLFSAPVSKIELTPQQIKSIPQMVESDLLRTLQTLPGVTSLSDFSSALYVRGGTPDQNLYLVDGTDVYNPEHAFGIFSTFNTNAIKKVEFSKGGFGAEYGGRLSSVLNVTNLDGNRNHFEGIVNISLLSATTTLQIPLGDFGSVSGSFRRTYIDQVYAKVIKEIPDYYFYDANLKAFFDLGLNDKLSVSFFNGFDDLDFKLDKNVKDSFGFLYSWGNTTASVNWKHIFGKKLFGNFWITSSRFRSDFNLSKILNFVERNELTDLSLKGSFNYFYLNNFNLKLGFEQKFLYLLYTQNWDEGRVDINNRRQYSTVYLSGVWKPDVLTEIETGLRINYFNSDKSFTNLSPRFSLKYRTSETTNIKFAAGMYHQYLDRIPRLFFSSVWVTANKYTDVSSANHLIFGFQKNLGAQIEFTTEAYYKNYKNIFVFNQVFNTEAEPDAYDNNGNSIYNTTKNLFIGGNGISYGVEFLLRKEEGPFNGWIAYSLSRTEYTFPRINQGKKFPPRHDRTHIVNVVLNFDLNNLFSGNWFGKALRYDKSWKLGLSFVYTSGQPITVPNSAYYATIFPDWSDIPFKEGKQDPAYNLYPGEINGFRLPPYIRLDLSLSYEIDYGNWKLIPYLQVFNLGNRHNVWFIDYEEKFENNKIIQTVDKTSMLPVIPSLGVKIKF